MFFATFHQPKGLYFSSRIFVFVQNKKSVLLHRAVTILQALMQVLLSKFTQMRIELVSNVKISFSMVNMDENALGGREGGRQREESVIELINSIMSCMNCKKN